MAIVIILVYGESRHLIPKPANYATLVDVAHAKFRELDGVANDNIAFHFTPEWFDAEVQMDGDAFSEVHARAVLRITMTVSAPAQPPGPGLKVQDADAPAQGPGSSSSKQESGSSVPSSIDWIPITVHYFWTGEEFRYEVDPDDTMHGLMDDASGYFFVDLDEIWFSFKQREFFGNDTPRMLGMKPEDTVEVIYAEKEETFQTFSQAMGEED